MVLNIMPTLAKKLEVYVDLVSCTEVEKILSDRGVYWYSGRVRLRNEKEICRIVSYLPLQAVTELYSSIQQVLDFRKKENLVIVEDIEAGMGLPYRVTGRKFLSLLRRMTVKPDFLLLEEAREKSMQTPTAWILVMIASLIALAGMALNNPYIIVGAMLISPILGPIYSFSVGVVLGEKKIAARSLLTLTILLMLGVLVSLVISGSLTIIGRPVAPTYELLLRTQVGWESLIIPVLLGTASILGVTSDIYEALVGVAIAAAIIPPAAALGWSLGTFPEYSIPIAENLAMNILGLLFGGTVTFLVLRGRI